MKGYMIDLETMEELWTKLDEVDLDNSNEVIYALGFAKGILFPIMPKDYEEIKPNMESEGKHE